MNSCDGCGAPITRHSRSGFCRSCVQKHTVQDSVSVKGNECEVTKIVPERVRSLEDLVRVCNIDLAVWEVGKYICNKWEVGARVGKKKGDKTMQVTPLFQVKAWLRRKVVIIAAREEVAELIASAKAQISAVRAPVVERTLSAAVSSSESPYMLEITIPDLHVGKLAWAKETGHENYDTKIALQVFHRALDALLSRTSSYTFHHIVFVVGNDLLNADNKANTTTRGTPQDTDSRFHKTFGYVRRMMTEAIERLRLIAPVVVYIVPGNHDTQAAWHLGDSLECYFHSTPDVTIHNEPTMRKYHQHGKVMLMWTHGDKGRLPDYPLMMAIEQPEMFGATLYREAHTGDKHHLRVQEHHGVRVRISPALCAPDAWHSENHYVGAQRAAEAFVWHADEGLVGTAVYTVSPAKDVQ